MKFKATTGINLRATPNVNGVKIGSIAAGTEVDSDAYTWKYVTLPNGTTGYCAADYLVAENWHTPIRADKFVVTQKFLAPDPVNYPVTGVHPGVDYGTGGDTNVPLYFCADGEVIDVGTNNPSFGNYFFYYVASVDRTFVYFHLRDSVPSKGMHGVGEQCGVAGQTGLAQGIHLHLECMKGRKMLVDRAALYTSKAAIMAAAEDADAFLRARL